MNWAVFSLALYRQARRLSWPANGQSATQTAVLAARFYSNLAADGDGPSALRDTQLWLRDSTNSERAAWLRPQTGKADCR